MTHALSHTLHGWPTLVRSDVCPALDSDAPVVDARASQMDAVVLEVVKTELAGLTKGASSSAFLQSHLAAKPTSLAHVVPLAAALVQTGAAAPEAAAKTVLAAGTAGATVADVERAVRLLEGWQLADSAAKLKTTAAAAFPRAIAFQPMAEAAAA